MRDEYRGLFDAPPTPAPSWRKRLWDALCAWWNTTSCVGCHAGRVKLIPGRGREFVYCRACMPELYEETK